MKPTNFVPVEEFSRPQEALLHKFSGKPELEKVSSRDGVFPISTLSEKVSVVSFSSWILPLLVVGSACYYISEPTILDADGVALVIFFLCTITFCVRLNRL
jgi:hypothetical protein